MLNPIYAVSTGHGNLGMTMGKRYRVRNNLGNYNGELQIIPDTLQPDCAMIMMQEGRIDPNVCVKNDLFVVTVTHHILHIVNEYTMTFINIAFMTKQPHTPKWKECFLFKTTYHLVK